MIRFVLLILLAGCSLAGRGAEEIRVLTFNIHAGRDADGKDNLDRVAALIVLEKADLVLLQEVDRGTTRSGGQDQLAELLRRTGLHGAFGKSLDYQGGEYGIAILSRWPITAQEVVPLRTDPPQPRAGGSLEPRIALSIVTKGLRVINTHLDASRDDTWRLQESATLAILTQRTDPAILGGDLNATPESAVHEPLRNNGLRDAWAECGSGNELTFSAASPVKRIDYVFLGDEVGCTSADVLETSASDHLPLLVMVKPR